jgi:Ran-interacting Mog1 protein
MSVPNGYCLRQLWGGAAQAVIPSSFIDLSDLRQVPDHQECWMDDAGTGGGTSDQQDAASRLLVFELLEHRDSVQDSDAARFYFADLADANGAHDDVTSFVDVPPSAFPLTGGTAQLGRSVFLGVGTQRVRMGRDHDLRGLPRVGQEVRDVRVEIAVIRLPAHQTDLLITLTTPTTGQSEGDPVSSISLSEPFQRAVGTFDIGDWSLLGSSS